MKSRAVLIFTRHHYKKSWGIFVC